MIKMLKHIWDLIKIFLFGKDEGSRKEQDLEKEIDKLNSDLDDIEKRKDELKNKKFTGEEIEKKYND